MRSIRPLEGVDSLDGWRGSEKLGRIVLIWALAYFWSTAMLPAELTWKERTVEINADPAATVLEAHYHFSNAGTAAVEVTDIHTSCGCTTAELEKRHYEPGEGGEIVARYAVDERIGLQTKTVLVSTSDLSEPTTLTLSIRLPEVLHFPQTFVSWKQGEDAVEKTLPMEVAPNSPKLEDLVVQPSNASVTARIQPAENGDGYALRVTPVSTERPMFTTLIIRYRVGAAGKSIRAYATVERVEPVRTGTVPAAGAVHASSAAASPASTAK